MSNGMSPDAGWTRPALLQQSREAAGLHIAALAAALKVPVKKLEALEAGRYEELPDLTFARALASSACRHLKIDPTPVLDQIPHSPTPALGDVPSAISAPFKSPQEAQASPLSDWMRRPAVLMSLALVAAAVGLMLVPDWNATVASLRQAAPEWAASAPAPSAAPTVVTERADAGSARAPVSAPSVAADVQPAAEPAATLQPSADLTPPETVAAPATTAALLQIKATGESWIEVVDGKGASQVQRMLKAGDVLDFSASPPYSIVIGRSDAVEVTVRGQRFDVTPFARNSVARFQVK
jgi:cytoskeleton protein RodZ